MKINIYGGPGVGKSTVASLVFAELKIKSFNVELVNEYTKELIYDGYLLKDIDKEFQNKILIEQLRRELIYFHKADIIVTDSPLMLNAFYNGSDESLYLSNMTKSRDDLNFYLIRNNNSFSKNGRWHNKKESLGIDSTMLLFLKKYGIDLIIVEGNSKEKSEKIVDIVLKKINNNSI